MLRELSIQDFVIVRELTLSFETGLSVLTGETGAGKSILVDALSLILGARASTSVIRPGASKAQVTAVFDSSPEINDWLSSLDLEGDEVLVLRRVLDEQGKSRAYINGTPTTISQLRELGERLVDIHGQHAHQRLLQPDNQRDMIDEFANLIGLRDEVSTHWQQWQAAQRLLERAMQDQSQNEEKRKNLTQQIEDLQQLSIQTGEWQQISDAQARLSNGQALLDGAQLALQLIEDEQSGAQKLVDQALGQLSNLVRHDASLSELVNSLDSASISLREARSDLSRYLDALDLDPEFLAQTESRMRALFDAARRHRCEPEMLPEQLLTYQQALDELAQSQDLDQLEARLDDAQKAYTTQATQLTAGRQKAAKTLQTSVTRMIRELGMPEGRFLIEIEPTTPGAYGADRIQLKVAGHDKATPAPMNKVASGGELSRISLALSVLASQANAVGTMIFDEIDVGVSGAVAEKIGELLRQLGQEAQVLCVTHLPQVASCAHHYFMVSKQKDDQGVYSEVNALLTTQARVEALARLLGGVEITQTTRDHALEMLSRFN
ncbi:DNA repair protein RecN [Orrella sp. 11846]|uniref:DNA repair protein RecN n=1 Tax=Orrella sp. 11846 TaxID=3409913 RepID=UPI003B5C9528